MKDDYNIVDLYVKLSPVLLASNYGLKNKYRV